MIFRDRLLPVCSFLHSTSRQDDLTRFVTRKLHPTVPHDLAGEPWIPPSTTMIVCKITPTGLLRPGHGDIRRATSRDKGTPAHLLSPTALLAFAILSSATPLTVRLRWSLMMWMSNARLVSRTSRSPCGKTVFKVLTSPSRR